MAQESKATQEKPLVQMKASDIKSMLDNGQGRKEIAKHYGVTQATLKRVINNHPVLRKLRVKPTNPIELIDDLQAPEAEAKGTATTAQATETDSAPTEAPVAQPASADKGVW